MKNISQYINSNTSKSDIIPHRQNLAMQNLIGIYKIEQNFPFQEKHKLRTSSRNIMFELDLSCFSSSPVATFQQVVVIFVTCTQHLCLIKKWGAVIATAAAFEKRRSQQNSQLLPYYSLHRTASTLGDANNVTYIYFK